MGKVALAALVASAESPRVFAFQTKGSGVGVLPATDRLTGQLRPEQQGGGWSGRVRRAQATLPTGGRFPDTRGSCSAALGATA